MVVVAVVVMVAMALAEVSVIGTGGTQDMLRLDYVFSTTRLTQRLLFC